MHEHNANSNAPRQPVAGRLGWVTQAISLGGGPACGALSRRGAAYAQWLAEDYATRRATSTTHSGLAFTIAACRLPAKQRAGHGDVVARDGIQLGKTFLERRALHGGDHRWRVSVAPLILRASFHPQMRARILPASGEDFAFHGHIASTGDRKSPRLNSSH